MLCLCAAEGETGPFRRPPETGNEKVHHTAVDYLVTIFQHFQDEKFVDLWSLTLSLRNSLEACQFSSTGGSQTSSFLCKVWFVDPSKSTWCLTATETIRLIRDGEEGGRRCGGWEREIIYLSLHCHHQNDACIKMGSDESHFNVSLIVRDKVIRLSTDHNF